MPLSGYLKTSDPGRISTIANSGSKIIKKKLIPTRFNSKSARSVMYVRDCETHSDPGMDGGVASVPVELFERADGGGWKSLGKVRCCPLCWRILQTLDGLNLPEPQPLPVGKDRSEDEEGKPVKKEIKPVVRARSSTTKQLLLRLDDLFSSSESFDVYEIADYFQVTRQVALRLLNLKIAEGKIIAESTGPGKGHRTQYRAP